MDTPQDQRPTFPEILALLVCERVDEDLASGRLDLIGVGHEFKSHVFDCTTSFAVYVLAANVRQDAPFQLTFARVIPSDWEPQPLERYDLAFKDSGPLGVSTCVVDMRNITFPAPGEYRFQIHCGGTELASRRFVAIRTEAQP